MKSSGLKVLTGSILGDDGGLAAAMRGHDVVISALGAGNSLKSSGLMERSAPVIVRAMQSQGVRRLIVVSASASVNPCGTHRSCRASSCACCSGISSRTRKPARRCCGKALSTGLFSTLAQVDDRTYLRKVVLLSS